MSSAADKTDPFDPFGVVASMQEWCCLLKAAQELRDADAEMLEAMLAPSPGGPGPHRPEDAARVRSVTALMRGLGLDPDALRRRDPETLRALEVVCLGCTERSRCTRELWTGTAAGTYPEFCPNAARLGRLRPT